jgi:hypothetical protein
MAETNGRDSEGLTQPMLAALPESERRILTVLSIVGKAWLSTEELAELAQAEEIAPIIADLRRRGLIETDARERHSLLGTVGEEIRKTNEALETGDRLLKYVETLANGGKLTPERLVDDAEAILGLSDWAAETEQWMSVLELVQTVEASFSVAERVEEWMELLQRGWGAARVLRDRGAEIAMLQHLSTASSRSGDQAAARRYAEQAQELQGPGPVPPTPGPAAEQTARSSGAARTLLIIGGLLATAAVGLGAGLLIAGNDSSGGSTTAIIPVTLSLPGQTITTSETTTLPAATVVSTEIATVTETVLTTTTVVVTTTPAISSVG